MIAWLNKFISSFHGSDDSWCMYNTHNCWDLAKLLFSWNLCGKLQASINCKLSIVVFYLYATGLVELQMVSELFCGWCSLGRLCLTKKTNNWNISWVSCQIVLRVKLLSDMALTSSGLIKSETHLTKAWLNILRVYSWNTYRCYGIPSRKPDAVSLQ